MLKLLWECLLMDSWLEAGFFVVSLVARQVIVLQASLAQKAEIFTRRPTARLPAFLPAAFKTCHFCFQLPLVRAVDSVYPLQITRPRITQSSSK